MFERFTDRARRVVALAQDEARGLKHNYVGTEHMLLGMLTEGEAVAFQALDALGITADQVRAAVIAKIGFGEVSPAGHIPFTPRTKKAMELALREALQLGHNYVGTEHLLLGLIREGEGVAAQVLVELGAELNLARQEVIRILSGYQKKTDRNLQLWLAKVKTVSVFTVDCSYCQANLTGGTGWDTAEKAVEAAKANGAILTTLGGMSFNGPPIACEACQKRPISEFRSEAS